MNDNDRKILGTAVELVELLAEQGHTPGNCIRIFTAAIGLTLSWSKFEDTEGVIQGIQDALNHVTTKEDTNGRQH